MADSGAPLSLKVVDGEVYLRATDATAWLRGLSTHWKGLTDSIPADSDPRLVLLTLAKLLENQANEVDFQLLVGLAS